jgi:hypothetical protein
MRSGPVVGSANVTGVRRVLVRALRILSAIVAVLTLLSLVLGLLSFVLAVPDIPAQVAKWKPWLAWVNYDVVRSALFTSGWVVVLATVAWGVRRRMTAKGRRRLEDYRELYRLSAEGAAREACMVMTHIVTSARTRDLTSNYLGRLVEECVIARTERSTSELAHVLQVGRDPEDAFVAFYVDYQKQVLWLRDAGETLLGVKS